MRDQYGHLFLEVGNLRMAFGESCVGLSELGVALGEGRFKFRNADGRVSRWTLRSAFTRHTQL